MFDMTYIKIINLRHTKQTKKAPNLKPTSNQQVLKCCLLALKLTDFAYLFLQQYPKRQGHLISF